MEDNAKLFETLIDRATDYGKTSFKLFKLNAFDKASEVVSGFIVQYFVFVLLVFFFLFISIGAAILLGNLVGALYVGFFIVASVYGLLALCVYFFMNQCIKRAFKNYFIKQLFN